ncbi:MAG TPA: site-specific integrase [Micrococcales bacterium]|uniref:site-specific integrase n=1 Tax=Miniimonas arenae TaxID=676201 RepID=UPI000EBA78AD|nr:tyrosine-type recombinase/integrase [Miniimonas arenae]HCX85212.1 site-specific integrase [Micrococcales bacterium]
MTKQPTPKQRRSQRGSVEDRWRKRIKDAEGNSVEVPSAVAGRVRRWRARYVDNAGREHTRHFDRKVQAQAWLDEQLAALLRGDHVAPSDAKMTVGEWCDKWLAGYGTRRASTVRQAEVHVKIIKAHFGSVPMSAIKPLDVRAWTVVLKREGRADSYIYAIYSRFSQIFTDAVHDGIVARNPCSRRTSPGMGKQRPYVATTRQVWALYDAVPPGVRPAILLGAHAGLRLAEASALRVTDVDFATGVVTPSVQWENEPLKSDTSRHSIPIPAEMSQLLAEAIPLGNGIQIVSDLWGNAGGPWTIERAVRAARTHVGLPDDFRFHDLRHYFASLLIASGLDVKVVQARLRHASAKTTLDTYGHLWPDRDDTSRAAVAAVYKERAEPWASTRRESSSTPSRRTPTASSERTARTSSSLSRSDRSSPSTATRPEDSLGL